MTKAMYRILSCDGGGIRGVITAKLLQALDPSVDAIWIHLVIDRLLDRPRRQQELEAVIFWESMVEADGAFRSARSTAAYPHWRA